MLERIVEQHNVGRRGQPQQLFDAVCALFVDCHRDTRKFSVYLVRFVAYVVRCGVCIGQNKSRCFALVTATENGHVSVGKKSYQIFGVRCFTRPAHGDVADADNGYFELLCRDDAFVEQPIAYARYAAKQARRQIKHYISPQFHLYKDTTFFSIRLYAEKIVPLRRKKNDFAVRFPAVSARVLAQPR